MKKKYIIHDEDGKEFKVEETIDETPVEEEVIEKVKDDDASVLTDDEIVALKKLAAVADKLVGLISDKVEDEEEVEEEEEKKEEEEIIDTDEDIEDEEEVETMKKTCDSKKSFNSIEVRRNKVDDSIDPSDDVNTAWAKRYNNRG